MIRTVRAFEAAGLAGIQVEDQIMPKKCGHTEGKQLVSKEWVRESTKAHVPESDFFDYGYHWWLRSGNKLQWWKEPNTASPEEHELITALGHGGQFIMIIRDLNLVVVTTASDFENGGMAIRKIPMVIEEIIPIFEDLLPCFTSN